MLIVKIMGGDDTADTDTRAQHRLIAGVIDTEFIRREDDRPLLRIWLHPEFIRREDDRPLLRIWLHPEFVAEGETGRVEVPLEGNVYVMNEAGKTVSSFGVAPIIRAVEPTDNEPETTPLALDRLTQRFLAWKLPPGFSPDGGIGFNRPTVPSAWPTGTNLLDYGQARDMLRHVLDLPE